MHLSLLELLPLLHPLRLTALVLARRCLVTSGPTSKKIADRCFATGSSASDFLDAYVRGEKALPITTTGVKGLPKVLRRRVVDTQDSGPSLLFLDLPVPPVKAGDPVPERFRSNVILQRLEVMQSQDLSVFGVSGCGKTRSVIEMLCLQWGFYFNAAKSDLGSSDLSHLADSIDKKTMEGQGPEQNTAFARNMTLVLLLSRLLVLKYCLNVPGCRQTFSSASWAILQVCPHVFEDVFLDLFKLLFKRLNERLLFELVLTTVIQDEFLLVHDLLTGHQCQNFPVGSKLRLVVDEAQVLSDKGSTKFRSYYLETDPRPMLSPVLNGFRNAGGPKELTIIYCGTGLSMKTLHWALSSGDGVKVYGSRNFPYIEFPGWRGPDSVQALLIE
ncbi:hypothetical protein BGX26_001886 [Mortierella sp. AD094]|nr:hypothetical protein BGX26_001886 [Mortierella sp. AD094]